MTKLIYKSRIYLSQERWQDKEGVVIKKAKTSHKGRKCKYPHCKHILSIYNHEAYCHVHLGLVVQKKKPKGS